MSLKLKIRSFFRSVMIVQLLLFREANKFLMLLDSWFGKNVIQFCNFGEKLINPYCMFIFWPSNW